MKCRTLIAVTACSLGLNSVNVLMAQQAQTPQPQPRSQVQVQGSPAGHAGQRMTGHSTEQTLATCLAIGNQEEIAIAKFAADKAESKEVKDFAQMLVKDHQAFLQKLQKFAPEASREGYLKEGDHSASKSEQETTSAQPSRVQNAGRKAAGGAESSDIQQTAGTHENSDSQPLDVIQLHRELAQECIQSAKQGLSKKEGKEFDECFVGHQIAAHAGMKNKLVVFERHVSGDLKSLLAEGIETTEKHMKKAESLMKTLANSNTSTAKRDRSNDTK